MTGSHFKELFSQICHGALANGPWTNLTQTSNGPGLYNYLADLCHVSVETVISWKTKGRIPSDPIVVSLLGEFGMEHVGMSFKWLEAFLREGNCFDTDLLERYRVTERPTRLNRAHHNLQAISGIFIERPKEVSRILEGFEHRYPVSIEGFGGMGKTTLASWVAERCLSGVAEPLVSPPFEFAVWVSAKDYPPDLDLSLDQVLNAIAERTGFTGLRDLPFEQKRGEVIELLRTRRVLVIIDNMETVTSNEVYEFLIRIPRQLSQVIMTTRHQQYRSVWQVFVGGLPEVGALRKIRHEIQAKNLEALMEADDAQLRPLYNITDGNPKAIELTLGYIKRTGILLTQVVSDLETATEELKELFDYLFKYHWEALDDPARNILLSLSFFASAARRDALQAATGLHRRAFKQAESQLREMSLLEMASTGVDGEPRYTAHALTRVYARRKLQELPKQEIEFRERWAEWCIKFAEANGKSWQTYDLLEDERENLMECAEWCSKNENWKPVLSIEQSLKEFFFVRGYWDARTRTGELASRAAKVLEDELAYAWVLIRTVSPPLEHLGRHEQRERLCNEALAIFNKHGNEEGIAEAYYSLGSIVWHLRGYAESFDVLNKSVNKWMTINDNKIREEGLGEAFNYLGLLSWRAKKLEDGKRFLRQAWDYRTDRDRPDWEATVLGNLGRIELEQGNLEEAEKLFSEALDRLEMVGHRYHIAIIKYEIARVKHKKGEFQEARKLLQEAKNVYLTIGIWSRTTEIITEMYCLEQEQSNLLAVHPIVEEMIALYERLEMQEERDTMMQLLKKGCPKTVQS